MLMWSWVHVQREIYETKWVDSFRDFAFHIRMQTIRCNLHFYSTGLVFLLVPAQSFRLIYQEILSASAGPIHEKKVREWTAGGTINDELQVVCNVTNVNLKFTLASASLHPFLLNPNGKRERMSQWFCRNKPCTSRRAKLMIKFLLQSAFKF